MRKRILAFIVALAMVAGMIPTIPMKALAAAEYPFTVTVGEEEITDISESILSWTDWSGSTSDVTCYTVTVPEESEEATLSFEEEKQWSYYDSKGNYVGADDTSWTSATKHTVAIQDSNGDGELDGISVQIPDAYSTEYFILFAYAAEDGEHVHTYDEGVVDPAPTCVADGVKTFTCNGCEEGTEGHSYTEPVTKTGHKYDNGEVTTPATCAAEGVKKFTCQNEGCTENTEGHTKTETIGKTAHTYDKGVVTIPATCTEAGVKTYTCSICPEGTVGHTKTETVPAAGHQRGDDTECDVCGDVAPLQDENDIYQIGNEKEMQWFADTVNSGENGISGVLTADIELDEDWPGIGISGKAFAGTFDGQNHTVELNGSTWGVFGNVKGTSSAYVQVKNLITTGTVKNTAIVHTAEFVKVENCTNRAGVGGDGSNSYVAGIVGDTAHMKKDCVIITNCGNEGNVTGKSYVAGILGNSDYSNAIITNCYNNGQISGTDNVAGIVGCIKGYPNISKIENSYNTGKIVGDSKTGGIVGFAYNNVNIVNCYNAGESDYAIAGYIYNNTLTITNTYYRGDICDTSVPNKTQAAGYYSGNRGVAMTSAEMSSEEAATALGEAFKQSCPSPVLTTQESANHVIENNVCQICKTGNDMPTEYKVTFVTPEGAEIIGDTTFRAGNAYTFSVNILEGYDASGLTVYVNGVKTEAIDGIYSVEKPDGPFFISVEGVKKLEGILSILLPAEGKGYRINPCEGYGATVESGKDYKFTVSFVEGFEAGEDFKVKANDEVLTADENGVYTIENIIKMQTITAEDIDVIPSKDTVTVNVEITRGENKFMVTEETETAIMDKQLDIPYFDLELYDLEKYYYNPNCYVDGNGNINGQQKVGNRESAYGVVTSMHAFIYMTEVYYLGYDPEDAGTGYSDTVDSDNDGKSDFDEAVSWTQSVGSSFMNLWGLGSNLNYHLNYEYPIAYEGWGSTSDQQALKDGDRLSVHMIEGSASGSGFGFFVVDDTNNTYDRDEVKDSVTVKQGDSITLTHYLATQGDHYTTDFVTVPDKKLYWVAEGDEASIITEWNSDENIMTDAEGKVVIDTTEMEPGTYYIGSAGGNIKGNGKPGSDGFISNGAESGPAYFKLIVEEAVEQECNHKEVVVKGKAATCTKTGLTDGKKCSVCGTVTVAQKTIKAKGHSYNKTYTVDKKATAKANGSKSKHCTVCDAKTSVKTIYKASGVKLSTASYTYNGKTKSPSVIIKDSKGNKISSNNYKLTKPSGRKKVGKYTYKITFKNEYSGTKSLTLTIKPKSTSIKSLSKAKKAFTVKWKKQSSQTTGYQIMYSTSKSFKEKYTDTKTISKKNTTKTTIKKLKAKKTYYVKIRTYKNVRINGKNVKVYSNWSKVKKVKTK